MIHPWAWVGWLAAALVALSATRNPLHLILTLLAIAVVHVAAAARSSFVAVSPLRFALIVIPLAALFNAATAHFGDTVLWRWPANWPVIGGPWTLEALTFGALNGWVLLGMLMAFTAMVQALPVRDLIRLIPRAFYPLAVVVSIGVTFVPVTLRQWQQIREAQAVRGHRVRGLRDWLPLFMPLLISGLERALQLAEAMTARGFAGSEQAGQDVRSRLLIASGLAALLGGGLLRLVWGREMLGLLLMSGGAGLVSGVLWVVGRRAPHTTYRLTPWTGRDWIVVLGAGLVVAAFILPGLDRTALFYYPYPKLTLPAFAPLVGLASLGLLGPAFLTPQSREETHDHL